MGYINHRFQLVQDFLHPPQIDKLDILKCEANIIELPSWLHTEIGIFFWDDYRVFMDPTP